MQGYRNNHFVQECLITNVKVAIKTFFFPPPLIISVFPKVFFSPDVMCFFLILISKVGSVREEKKYMKPFGKQGQYVYKVVLRVCVCVFMYSVCIYVHMYK